MVDLDGLLYYEVGGAVRDSLLDREPNDVDYVVVGADQEEMEDRGFMPEVGESFGVFLHPETKDEWALARTETKVEREGADAYKQFEITADGDVTLQEDLLRRDLTINAMARNPETGEIIDPFGGQEDLENEVIRHISPAFAEDPVRVLRAARFAARFDFTVDPDTMGMLQEVAPRLRDVEPDRIFAEMLKNFRQADTPRKFFDVLKEAGALDIIIPELAWLDWIPAGPAQYHGEGSAYEHTMMVLEEAHKLRPNDERVLLAATFHDIGKSAVAGTDTHFYRHEKMGVSVAERVAERLDAPREYEGVMKSASRYHSRIRDMAELNESTVLETFETLRDDYSVDNPGDEAVVPHITPDELIDLGTADSRGRIPSSTPDRELARARFQVAEEALESITGHDVLEEWDMDASPKVGDLLWQERVEYIRANED